MRIFSLKCLGAGFLRKTLVCARLIGLAAVLCIQPYPSLAGTLAESRAEFDRVLLKTRVMDSHCLPLPSVLKDGNIHLVDPIGAKGALKEDGYWKADVIVGDTRKTNHLLLQTDSDTIWSLTVDRFAELGSIIVFGSGHGVVAGVPDGTLVYSLDRNADGSRALPCKTRDKAEKDLDKDIVCVWFFHGLSPLGNSDEPFERSP